MTAQTYIRNVGLWSVDPKWLLNVLIGVSLALTLLTRYRFLGPVGIGELGIVLAIALTVIGRLITRETWPPPATISLALIAVVVAVILPMTLYSQIVEIRGSSFRDLGAYFLCAVMILVIPNQNSSFTWISRAFFTTTVVLVVAQYFLGGAGAWYYGRYTAGAANPNQLALYICAALTLIPVLRWKLIYVLSCGAVLCYFGYLSRSDAFLAFAVIGVLALGAATILPSGVAYVVTPIMISGAILFLGAHASGFFRELNSYWLDADQGGVRTVLYRNAAEAWLSSPLSLIFGHGAGSYSGVYGPFSGSEAHNTPLDALTIAGLGGLLVMFLVPLYGTLLLHLRRRRLYFALAIAFISFTLFHYVGRQPIFWFTVVVILAQARPPVPSGKT